MKKLVQETVTDVQVSCASRLVQDSCTSFLTACHQHFYPRDATLARVIATAMCLSVRLSVCHTTVLCLAERKQDREMYTI